jgi:hypothetical protein
MDCERYFDNEPIKCRKCRRRLVIECGYVEEPRSNEFAVPCPCGHTIVPVSLRGEEITDVSIAE